MEFYLADYRFANNASDYIVRDWTFVNLASLGAVSKLTFGLTSSDVVDTAQAVQMVEACDLTLVPQELNG